MDTGERSIRAKIGATAQAGRAILDKAETEKRGLTAEEETQYQRVDQELDILARQLKIYQKENGGGEDQILADFRAAFFGAQGQTPEAGRAGATFAVDVRGQRIPVLARGERLASHYPHEKDWSVGDFVRASMGIEVREASVVERGVALVPDFVSAQIIDAIRAKTRVIQAGALTIPIEGKTSLARIDADPTVIEHTEGAGDITESLPTFSPVSLDPKTLAAMIPLSIEVVADSPNLDQALNRSIAAAFASKLDTLSIATILADATIPTSGAGENTASWAGVIAALGSMLAANQDIPTALICGPGDFAARAGELSSETLQYLGPVPVLATMLDLPTTSMSDGTAVYGGFAAGFGIAVRQELRLEVVRWGKAAYGSHLLVAYARMAGYVLQPNALYIQAASVE